MKIAILTDTSLGIPKEEVKSLGYEIFALPFVLDEVEYDELNLSKKDFYEKLKSSKNVHTSQAPLNVVTDTFDRLLKDYDKVLYFPITSGLSSAYESILPIVEEEYKDKVVVFDHKTISVLQRGMLEDVTRLLKKGESIERIKEKVEANGCNNRIYIAVDDLENFKKGGRVDAFSAAIGSILNIKPILFSNGNKFEVVKKARGIKQAEEEIKNLIQNDLNELFPGVPKEKFKLGVAYTECLEEASKFKDFLEKNFSVAICMDELSAVIACHVGPGAVASAIYRKLDED